MKSCRICKFLFNGKETEIDRNVADRILDPLIHILKNAISHGIESEEERTAKGKPALGLVSILAYSKRGNVYIEVADNGRGLPVDKIYQKAVDRGLLNPAQDYTEDEIIEVIFNGVFTLKNIHITKSVWIIKHKMAAGRLIIIPVIVLLYYVPHI